jgi:hypothetical protein
MSNLILMQRVAARKFAEQTKKKPLYSMPVYQLLRRAFGMKLLPFFTMYADLRDFYDGDIAVPEEGFSVPFREMVLLLRRRLARDTSKDLVRDLATKLFTVLRRLESAQSKSGFLFIEAIELYAEIIDIAAQDRDIFLKRKRLKYPGFIRFLKMSPKEEKMKRLKRDNPDLYAVVQKEREIQKRLDEKLEYEVRSAGLEPGRKEIFGKVVVTGKDPVTGEEVVYDREGQVLSISDYITKLKEDRKAKQALTRVFPDNLDDLRRFPDDLIDEMKDSKGIRYVALTDDEAKQSSLTRIYPVMDLFGEEVIVEGRFKGISLPDMVNRAGRMIEGSAYDYSPALGRPVPLETRRQGKLINVDLHNRLEPYITRDGDALYLKIPSKKSHTEMRNAMYALSQVASGVDYVDKSRRSTYRFDPEEFGTIRNLLHSVALSQSAMEMVREHYTETAKSELAVEKSRLTHYGKEELGGVREGGEDLYIKQKQSLAWLDSRGGNGLVALDTGLGKTKLAVAYILNLKREGLLDGGKRVLYVSPAKLKGNLEGEARAWLSNPDKFLQSVDFVSYEQLSRAPMNLLDQYEAVIFDEAQNLKNVDGTRRGAIVNRFHPKKVLLTASPMERDPMEVRKLAAIANNEDLKSPEGREALRLFEKRYCEKIGSRTVGLKEDAETRKSLRVWMKQNLFFAHKQDVEEIVLPQLRKASKSLSMPDEMEDLYKGKATKIRYELEGLTRLYKHKDPRSGKAEFTGAFVRLAKELGELRRISNLPDLYIEGLSNPKIDASSEIIEEGIEAGSRTLLWTSSSEFATHTGRSLSMKFPGTKHAVALSGEIQIWKSGVKVESYTKRIYKDVEGQAIPAEQWAKFVMDNYVKANRNVRSCTLTDSYATGQNLQDFDTVIHLERADNSEVSKQRTARAYRNGQRQSVREYHLDVVYSDTGTPDVTIDEIRKYIQTIEEDLFEEVIVQSQSERLGAEYFDMSHIPARFYEVERRTIELLLSPVMRDVWSKYSDSLNPVTLERVRG